MGCVSWPGAAWLIEGAGSGHTLRPGADDQIRGISLGGRHDLGHRLHVGVDELLLLALGYLVVIEGAHDLRANLRELLGREVEVLVGIFQRQAGVFEWSAGERRDPERPHELETR